MKNWLIFISLIFSVTGFSQIAVTNTMTPAQLVQNILVGTGITPYNIKYNGSLTNANVVQANASYFSQNGTTFSYQEGVLLTSGAGTVAIGPNSSGSMSNSTGTTTVSDVDLNAIANNTVYNGVSLEFDFIATGDTVAFNYIFASEEYPEYAPSTYNDVFGFFLSGPGLSGPYQNGAVNIAVIPGTTTPITINNVNASTNSSYYQNNLSGLTYGSAIQYDGTTVSLTASSQLQCGQVYHIKLGIANVGDQGWDSGVFLEGHSFSSNLISVDVTPSYDATFTDTLLAEGCVSASIMFIRPESADTNVLTVPLYLSGTADPIADFNTAIPNTITFPLGVDTVLLYLDPIADNLVEGIESLDIGFYNYTLCGDSIYDSIIMYITDFYEATFDFPDTIINTCIINTDQAAVTNIQNSVGPFTVQWTSINDTIGNPMTLPSLPSVNDTIYHYITFTDGCGRIQHDSLVYLANPQVLTWYMPDTVINACLVLTDSVQITDFQGAPGPYSVSWSFGDSSNPAVLPSLQSEGEEQLYYVIITDGCSMQYEDSVLYFNTPQLLTYSLIDTVFSKCVGSVDSVQVSNFSGAPGPYTVNWSFGGIGNHVELPGFTQNETSVTYIVGITDACNRVYIDSIVYQVDQTLKFDTVFSGPSSCLPDGWVATIVEGETTTPTHGLYYQWSGPGANSPNTYAASAWQNLSSGWYYITVEDAVCSISDSAFVDILNPPSASIQPDTLIGCGPFDVSLTNESQNATSYTWVFGDGSSNISTTETTAQEHTFVSSSVVMLLAYQNTCADTAYAVVIVNTCGCTDPTSLNYNPNANVDDGSCQYPVPSVEVPNVFTPNNDGKNDTYFLITENAVKIDMIILNRWGNVMYNVSGLNPVWDGTSGGAKADDGVYFVKYVVYGVNGDKIEGSSFFELIRNH